MSILNSFSFLTRRILNLMPKLPVSIGKYKITGRLGKGGMSVLYLAEHPSLGTTVVLKKLTLKGDSAHRERFRREATLMMKLRHENVVGVYDHFKEGGSHYLVMEFVDGRPLSELMAREGALPETEARWLAGRIAKALAHIHSRGIVHRDLKPSNVLLGRDGGVKLGDFGIAFTPGGDDDITSEGTALGTPTFMAPEQLEDARGADERSDMWSFGVCLFEMLTGRKFVTGPSPAAVREALPAAVKTMSYRLPPKLPRREHRLLRKTLRMKSETRLKDGKAALRLLGASGRRDIPPEALQTRLNKLLLSMEGGSEPTPKAEIIPDKDRLNNLSSGGLSSLKSLFKSSPLSSSKFQKEVASEINTAKSKKMKALRLPQGKAVLLIVFFAVLLVFFVIPGTWNTVFRRNSYGVFKLKLVYPAEAPEHWLTAASANVYSEGDDSLYEILSPTLHISADTSSLNSRRITLPAGAYRIRWSLGDRVSWYSFRLPSFSARENAGNGMMTLEETLEDPPVFPLELSWAAVDAADGSAISGHVKMSWERIDMPRGELVSGGTYRFLFEAPGYLPSSFDITVSPWRRNLNLHASLWPQPAELTIRNASGRLIMPRLNGSGVYLDMNMSPGTDRIGRLKAGSFRVLSLIPGDYLLTPGLGKSGLENLSLKSGDTVTAVVESDEEKQFIVRLKPSK